MRVGSLFSGIGGFDLGFERAGMSTAWFCEQDDFCQSRLRCRWPGVPIYPDVTTLRGADVEPVDVLCGGFPCQDLSGAGRGAGLDGARSGLWGDFARLIRELRPRYVVVENVPDLLTGRGKRWPVAPISRVHADLAEAGFDAEWAVLSAAEFGAPHLRERVWIVAYPAGEQLESGPSTFRGATGTLLPADPYGERCEQGVLGTAGTDERSGKADLERRGPRPDLADTNGVGRQRRSRQLGQERRPEPTDCGCGDLHDPDCGALQPWRVGGRVAQAGGSEWWAVEPPVRRVAYGVPDRLDRLAALGNALVPQIAEWIGKRIMTWEASAPVNPAGEEKGDE